jgi:hypothetical protein
VVAAVPLVAGCGSQPDLTCQTQISDYGMGTATVAVWIGRLVAQQTAQDQAHTEGWVDATGAVTYPDGDDLETVALAFGMLPLSSNQPAQALPYQVDNATQLGGDASNFADDVGIFLGDASIGGLSYGWQSEYAQVRTDIGTVASDCSVPHVGM